MISIDFDGWRRSCSVVTWHHCVGTCTVSLSSPNKYPWLLTTNGLEPSILKANDEQQCTLLAVACLSLLGRTTQQTTTATTGNNVRFFVWMPQCHHCRWTQSTNLDTNRETQKTQIIRTQTKLRHKAVGIHWLQKSMTVITYSGDTRLHNIVFSLVTKKF